MLEDNVNNPGSYNFVTLWDWGAVEKLSLEVWWLLSGLERTSIC